jgi:hypothetical protein
MKNVYKENDEKWMIGGKKNFSSMPTLISKSRKSLTPDQ